MDFISDNFISYGDTFTVKQEKLSDEDPSKVSLLSGASDSTSPCTGSIPPTLQNFLNSSDPSNDAADRREKQVGPKKHKPFRIIKAKQGEPAENIILKIETDEKLLNRTKRILKRVKAKQRIQLKQEYMPLSSPSSSKYAQEVFNDSKLDDKSKKKIVQMIRNRISAQNSRDRKKNYLNNLEHSKNRLAEDNLKLRNNNAELLKEVKRLQGFQAQLCVQNELIRKSFGLIYNSSNEDCSKSLIGNEGNIALTHPFGKSFEEVSSMVLLKFPNWDKSLFNNVFTLATFISLNVMTNMNQGGSCSSEGIDRFEEVGKMMSRLFASGDQKEDENSSLITYLNDFSMKSDHNTRYKEFFESHLQAERALSQSSDIIKIEESDVGNGIGFYPNSSEAGFISKGNMIQNAQEDQGFNLFSPRNFKSLDGRDSKDMGQKNGFEELDNFQDDQLENADRFPSFTSKPSVFGNFVDLNEVPKPQPEIKENSENGLMGLLFKALVNSDLLQNTNQ